MGKLEIRVARSSDEADLHSALGPDIPIEQIRARLDEAESGHRMMLVALVDQRAIATASWQLLMEDESPLVRLFALDVGERFRRRGIARSLVAEVETEAVQHGASGVFLEVAVDNLAAISLYEKLGYVQDGEPFVNEWTRRSNAGPETVRELSVLMRKPVLPA